MDCYYKSTPVKLFLSFLKINLESLNLNRIFLLEVNLNKLKMSTEKTYTREELIKNLKESIELQSLQTELQELRTRLVSARFNEIKITLAFEEMTAPPETPTTEDIEKLQAVANERTSTNKKA